MKKKWGLLLLLCSLLATGCAGSKKQAVLTVYDSICLPGELVELKAKVESDSLWRGRLKKQKIFFYQAGALIGEAISGNKGWAAIPYQTEQTGFFEIEARLASDKFVSEPARLLLRVASPETPFLVVDIDNTLSDLSPILMLLTENAAIPPIKGAPETLQKLSEHYTILYITGRDDVLSFKTKEWLHKNKFPEGPVFFWDFLQTALSKQKYKSELIAQIGRKFQLIQIGIGNSVGDAAAYLANGLQTIILLSPEEKNRGDRLPRGTKVVRSWEEIQKLLF